MKKILRISTGIILIAVGAGSLLASIAFALNSELTQSLLFSVPLGLFGLATILFGIEILRGGNLLKTLESFLLSS